MKPTVKRANKPSSEAALLALQKEMVSMRRRLDRGDNRINALENKVKELEAERDHFKELCYKALADIRVKDKRIIALERNSSKLRNNWLGFENNILDRRVRSAQPHKALLMTTTA